MQEDLQKKINLNLLSDFMHCIICHSDSKDALTIMNNRLSRSIYHFYLTSKENIFLSSHNLLYIGEFLVYYNEKGFYSKEDFRAIALALAHTKELQNDSMFHDTQLDDFMHKIASYLEQEFDIYLAVALYQLTPNIEVQNLLLKSIAEAHYNNATDCIFSLMLYPDKWQTAELLMIMLTHICTFLEQPDTLNFENNIYTYAFLIQIYQTSSIYKKYPQGTLLQTLTSLKEKRANIKSSTYQKLIKAGYSNKQIKYLNCILPTLFSNEKSLDTTKLSYIKNVVEYCKAALQNIAPLSEIEQQYISDLFWKHRSLAKNYDKKDSLLDATLTNMTLSSNENYIWLFTYLRNHNKLESYIKLHIFAADPKDSNKSEVYAHLTEKEAYAVFLSYLLSNKTTKEELKATVEAFQKCTGFDILNLYKNNYQIAEDSSDFIVKPNALLFAMLIYTDILSCSDYMEELKNNTLSYDLKKVFQYFLKEGSGKDIVAFLEQFDKELGIFKINNALDFSLYQLFKTKGYNYYNDENYNSFDMNAYLTSKRFSKEEKQKLFLLLVKYSYYICNSNCSNFIANFLLNDNCDIIFTSKELKSLYDKLLSLDFKLGYRKDELNKKFMPKKQYEQLTLEQQEKERKEKEEQRLADDNHVLENIKNQVEKSENPINKLQSILHSYGYHVYDDSKKFSLINTLLEQLIQSEQQEYLQESLPTILSIKQSLYNKGFLTFEVFMQSMNEINAKLKEGVVS